MLQNILSYTDLFNYVGNNLKMFVRMCERFVCIYNEFLFSLLGVYNSNLTLGFLPTFYFLMDGELYLFIIRNMNLNSESLIPRLLTCSKSLNSALRSTCGQSQNSGQVYPVQLLEIPTRGRTIPFNIDFFGS